MARGPEIRATEKQRDGSIEPASDLISAIPEESRLSRRIVTVPNQEERR